LDTAMWWHTYGMIRRSVIDRGRAVPLVGTVREHGSAQVRYDADKELWDRATLRLPPPGMVVLWADRGCADTDLMAPLPRLGWHWRRRSKSTFWLYRPGRRPCQGGRLSLAQGQACVWPAVWSTEKRYGPGPLAVARPRRGQEWWYVLSDEPTHGQPWQEYGLRCAIEENFVDDKSPGCELASALIRSAPALRRLCCVIATATLSRVSQGIDVVPQGKRRWVAAQWFRGRSDLKMGWNWVKLAGSRGSDLITQWHVCGAGDPAPAMASQSQYQRNGRARVVFDLPEAAYRVKTVRFVSQSGPVCHDVLCASHDACCRPLGAPTPPASLGRSPSPASATCSTSSGNL
jgi:hypothetical protein